MGRPIIARGLSVARLGLEIDRVLTIRAARAVRTHTHAAPPWRSPLPIKESSRLMRPIVAIKAMQRASLELHMGALHAVLFLAFCASWQQPAKADQPDNKPVRAKITEVQKD